MHSVFSKLLIRKKDIFTYLVIGDLIVLLLHLFLGGQHSVFHLDLEQNIPTFYQSLKLLVFGTLFLLMSVKRQTKQNIQYFTVSLAAFLLLLGIDELFQVHENIYRLYELFEIFHPSKIVESSMKLGYRSSLWILYYLPFIFVFFFWSGYWLRFFQSRMKKNAWILILSCGCLFMVLMAEILSSTGDYGDATYYWLITMEEIAEMLLASTLILIGTKVFAKYT